MSVRLAIVADPAAAGVAGLDGSFHWGEATTVAPGAPLREADLVVVLGSADAGGREPDVRWLDAAPPAAPTADRLVAPRGEGLWSRAPWPVRDELFDVGPPEPGAGLLVVTADEERDALLLEKLAGRDLPVRTAAALTADALTGAAIVAFPPEADGDAVPGARQEAAPVAVFPVIAARRLLIAPRARATFGLLPGVDHLAASTDDDVVQYADALHAFPEAFAPQVALGRIAAERQRASTVYGRLVADLRTELHGA
jgi:hypothetical protein